MPTPSEPLDGCGTFEVRGLTPPVLLDPAGDPLSPRSLVGVVKVGVVILEPEEDEEEGEDTVGGDLMVL